MFNRITIKLAALALVAVSTMASVNAQAASAQAGASITDRTSSLLTFSNDQFLSDASTPFQSGFDASSTLQSYSFNNTTPSATSFAEIDNSFAPFPATSAGAIGTGRGSASVLWTFDWTATDTGVAQLNLEYLYSATVASWSAGQTGIARSFVSVLLDGTSNSAEDLNFFQNSNNNTSGFNNLILNFNVVAGQTGSFTVTVASDAIAAPVPVPAAVWLLGSALTGLGAFRRRHAA